MAKADPRGGVVRITVFEEPSDEELRRVRAGEPKPDMKPVAERLVFRKPGEALNLGYSVKGASGPGKRGRTRHHRDRREGQPGGGGPLRGRGQLGCGARREGPAPDDALPHRRRDHHARRTRARRLPPDRPPPGGRRARPRAGHAGLAAVRRADAIGLRSPANRAHGGVPEPSRHQRAVFGLDRPGRAPRTAAATGDVLAGVRRRQEGSRHGAVPRSPPRMPIARRRRGPRSWPRRWTRPAPKRGN